MERLALIVDTLNVGEIGFDSDGKLVGKSAGRMLDGYAAPKSKLDLTPGWHPYVSCLMVFVDGGLRGEVATFTGCSWAHFSRFKGR